MTQSEDDAIECFLGIAAFKDNVLVTPLTTRYLSSAQFDLNVKNAIEIKMETEIQAVVSAQVMEAVIGSNHT